MDGGLRLRGDTTGNTDSICRVSSALVLRGCHRADKLVGRGSNRSCLPPDLLFALYGVVYIICFLLRTFMGGW